MASPTLRMISKAVAKGLSQAKLLESATLIVVTPGTRTPGAVSAGTQPTETAVSCQGMVETERVDRVGETEVTKQDRVVKLVGYSLGNVVPKPNDRVTIAGVTSRVVDLDGSIVMWTLLART